MGIIILLTAHGVKVSVFRGGAALVALESAVEGGQAGKARLDGYLGHGKLGNQEHLFCGPDPLFREVFVEGVIGVFFEQSGKVEFGKTGKLRRLLQGNALGVVVVDEIQDNRKLVHDRAVFHGGGGGGRDGDDVILTDLCKKAQKTGVDIHLLGDAVAPVMFRQIQD